MKSLKNGKNISRLKNPTVEVLQVSIHGIWIMVADQEYFMSHAEFPWFRDATIQQINNVTFEHNYHLRWKDLDVDLHLDSLSDVEKYSLVYKK